MKRFRIFCLFTLSCLSAFAQTNTNDNEEPQGSPKKSKFLTGFYLGSYFANKYSATTYNGYGFDLNGNQNSFLNSPMYQKIKNEYGGGFGQIDYIAQELGVDPKQWEFNETDMPAKMRYLPAILLGFNFRLPVEKKGAFIFNVNGTRLNVEGIFTITTLRPQTSSNPVLNSNIQTFPIKGQEQRLQFMMGYQKIFGKDEKTNFFGELGFIGTLAKFDKNWIQINNLRIDLMYYENQTINPVPVQGRVPVGFGIGAFMGAGMHIDMNQKFTLQLMGNLSHEKINFGVTPVLKLNGGVGFRVYYNI